NAGHVLVHVQDAVLASADRRTNLREVHRAARHARVEEVQQARTHLTTDVGLRLFGRAANVRGEDRVLLADQLRLETGAIALWLLGEDVDGRAGEVPRLERLSQRRDVHDVPARQVDEVAALLHAGELLGADHVLRL